MKSYQIQIGVTRVDVVLQFLQGLLDGHEPSMATVLETVFLFHPFVEFHRLMGAHVSIVFHHSRGRFVGCIGIGTKFVELFGRGVGLNGSNVDGDVVGFRGFGIVVDGRHGGTVSRCQNYVFMGVKISFS